MNHSELIILRLILNSNAVFYAQVKQEYIPVGCVPFAAVAVTGGRGVSPKGGLPREGVWQGGFAQGGVCQTSPVDRITDTCKNITLPQLRCGR